MYSAYFVTRELVLILVLDSDILDQICRPQCRGAMCDKKFLFIRKTMRRRRPQLLLLQKNMVVVEGVARSLDDDANIWDISKPILEGWLTREKGPKATIEQAIHTTNDMMFLS